MKKWMALVMSMLALGLVVAGCGGDDDDENGDGAATTEQTAPAETAPADTGTETETEAAGGGALQVTADETAIAWEPTELSAPAGSVTITLDNPSQTQPHNIVLEGVEDGSSDTITDSSTEVTAELEAGEYTYFCSVGGHRQQGMEGTLTVE